MVQTSVLQTFNDLYARNYSKFVRFAYTYVRDETVAEDFVTEAFMTYWDNKDGLKNHTNIRAYILTIVKNKCLNYLRNTKFQASILKKMTELAEWEINLRINTLKACDPNEIFSSEVQELVDKALAGMSKKTLEVFMLSRYQNKTNKEIAEIMNISVKGVEFHMTKALNILRKELKDYLSIFLFIIYLIP